MCICVYVYATSPPKRLTPEQNVTSVTPLIWSGVAYVQLWPQSEAIDLRGHYTLFDKQYKIGIYWQVS